MTVATKGGIRRPNGAWVLDGRAKHLRAACDASRRALGVDAIDLYQLHAVDPNVPVATSVRALATLREEGKVRRIGLRNVNLSQLEAARAVTEIDAVQVSLSVFDDESLRNGVAEYCRDHGVMPIAHTPLAGARGALRIARDPFLSELAAAHGASPHGIALAWLLDLGAGVIPIPGATRVETAAALADVSRISLSEEQRALLEERFPAGRLLRVSQAQRRPRAPRGDVVLVMGMPGSGKTTAARELVAAGYERLNRDERGGSVSELIPALDEALAQGRSSWVLDNTYASRRHRNEVIETAWRHGAAARCIHVGTSLADAQINAVSRMIEALGRLPMPEEAQTLGRNDPRFFGPDAQFGYQRRFEAPTLAEGFERIEERVFQRRPDPARTRRALVLELDGVICASAAGAGSVLDPEEVVVKPERARELQEHAADGWILCAVGWRPQLTSGETTVERVEACSARVRALVGVDIDVHVCPHPAGPPMCWCRKPLPGLLLQLAQQRGVALERSVLVGRAPVDRTLAVRLGMEYREESR